MSSHNNSILNTDFFAPASSKTEKAVFLTRWLESTSHNQAPLNITLEIEELFKKFSEGRMTVEELLSRVEIAERASSLSNHNAQRP